MVKQNTAEGHMKKMKLYYNQVGLVKFFEFRDPELYKLVTTITRDDDNQNIYTVLIGQCNEQTSDDES